jgi:hypothetical protein
MDISIDDMRAEFERLTTTDEGAAGWTTKELMKHTGWSQYRTDKFVRQAMQEKWMRCEWRLRESRDGIKRRSPVYIWIRKRGKR